MLFPFWNILCVISFILVVFVSEENTFLQAGKEKFDEGGFVGWSFF